MKLSVKIAQNTVVQIISKVLSTILGLMAFAIMARYLGKNGFGEYTTIITFLSFFAIIADLGLTLVTVQMISGPEAEIAEKKIIDSLFTLRLILAVIFLGLAPLAVLFFPYSQEIKMGVLLTSLSFIFIALNQILVALFQKKLVMGKVAIAENASRVALVAGVALAYYFNLGLTAILWATIISSFVSFACHFLFARRFVHIKLAGDLKIWKAALKRSWPLALTIVFNLIYLKTDTLILSLLKSETEVGIYGSTYKIIDVLVTIPFMFAGVILPILTVSWMKNSQTYFNSIFQRAYNFLIIIAIPLTIGTQFLAKNIMVLAAGQKFADAGPVLQILIGAASLVFISCLFSHIIIAINKVKNAIGAYIFTAITAVAGYLIFIPKYSYFGAAWMTIYSETAILIFTAYYAYRYTKFFPRQKIAFKSLLASAGMAGVLFLIPQNFSASLWGFGLTAITAMAAYLIFLVLLRGLTLADFKIFWPAKDTPPLNSPLDVDNS